MQLIQKKLHQKAPVHFIKTDKFKRIHLSIRFFALLDEKTVTKRYLTMALMRAKNQQFATRKALSRHLESLYDANFSAQATKLGRYHLLQFSMTFVNPKLIKETDYKDQILDVFASLIKDVSFDEATLALEKQFLKDYFKAEYSNKNRYAAKRYYAHLYDNHPYNIHPFGLEKKIDAVTIKDIETTHQALMTSNPTLISLSGDFDIDAYQTALEKRFAFNISALPKDFFIDHAFLQKPAIKETLDVTQDRLFMTFNTHIKYGDQAYYGLLVMNALFGESSESMLFDVIREQHALAYYVHASYAPFSGLITVNCGVKSSNVEKTKTLILDTLAAIAQNKFSDEAYIMAKNSLIIQLKQSYDRLKLLPSKGLQHVLFDMPLDKDVLLAKLSEVTKEDVVEAAQQCQWIFTYVLGGKSDENPSISKPE